MITSRLKKRNVACGLTLGERAMLANRCPKQNILHTELAGKKTLETGHTVRHAQQRSEREESLNRA